MPAPSEYEEYLAVAVSAAIAAGDVIKAAFHLPKEVIHKGAVDLVTATDQACENIVQSRLKEAFPSHRWALGSMRMACARHAASFSRSRRDGPRQPRRLRVCVL
jgi:hypothetical protein